MSSQEITEDDHGGEVDDSTMHRAIAGAATGNALEWFDFGVYGYFATTIGHVFFPSQSDTAALLSSFAVFASAFVARPFGSLVFGPLGDKIGRSGVLIATILIMSVGTSLVGVLPSYESIGIWSPILLIALRMIQGFSTGGEYGSAATFIVEYAPDDRRGFLASWLEFGTLTGYSFAAILALILDGFLGNDAMTSWGWRIPFLMAAPMGIFGVWLRLHLEDSPAFKELQDSGEVEQAPFRTLFAHHWRTMMLCLGLVLVLNVAYYTVLKYMPSYFTSQLDISEFNSVLLSLGILVGMLLLVTPLGRLSDKIGRKPLLYIACGGLIVFSIPGFYLMSLGSLWLAFAGLALIAFFVVFLSGVMPSTLPAIFRTNVRNGGFTISYNVSTALFGGTAPFLITWLISVTDNTYVPAFYLMLAAAIALIPAIRLRESANAPLLGSKARHGRAPDKRRR
ncbi:MFS transporter [Salinisphaera aquimarina]|uniref:MFS transporter n=1 Tax=Salinisphaera aquimarina TaxID=2094031 RepID=A0ABV7EMN0_9GAMM